MDFLNKHTKSFGGDQAPLNYIFQDDCMFLSEKFNRFPAKKNDDEQMKNFLHVFNHNVARFNLKCKNTFF